jgi:hypothetical protein
MQIMTVDRSEIADIESLKKILLFGDERFDTVVESQDPVFIFLRNQSALLESLINVVSDLIVLG